MQVDDRKNGEIALEAFCSPLLAEEYKSFLIWRMQNVSKEIRVRITLNIKIFKMKAFDYFFLFGAAGDVFALVK
jgi:hypothetical protein